MEYAEIAGVLLFGLAGLFVITRDSVHKSLYEIWPGVPFFLWALITLMGDLFGRLAAKKIRSSYAKDTWMTITDHPAVKSMEQIGWKAVYVNPSRPFPVFSRTRQSSGLGTAITDDSRSQHGDEAED